MSFEAPALMLPGQQSLSDNSAKQFFCAKMSSTAGNVDLQTTSGGAVLGIFQNKPKAGDEAQVATAGVSKAVAGAAVALGALLMVNGSGQVITYVGGGTNSCLGVALEATVNGASDVIAVALIRGLASSS